MSIQQSQPSKTSARETFLRFMAYREAQQALKNMWTNRHGHRNFFEPLDNETDEYLLAIARRDKEGNGYEY